MNQIENQQSEPKYLKSEQHYADLYDRYTVDECRRLEKELEHYRGLKPKKSVEKIAKGMAVMTNEIKLYVIKGERYSSKKETIREWMHRDKIRDELFENARAPENITCLTCGRLMFVVSKDLWTELDKKDRVLFMYECPLKHIPLRSFYNDGEERRIKPDLCPKCNAEMKSSSERKKDTLIFINTCPKCDHVEKSELTLGKKEEEKIDPDFAKDRERFCMTEEEGQKYIDAKYKLKATDHIFEEHKMREKNKELYEKISTIKKLKIIEVEELLGPALEAKNYVRLQLQAPEIKKDILVPFSIHDAKERSESQSMGELKKAITKTLQGTNWRLMSDGVDYRLGMLSGRLRGYEREEDLLELVRLEKKKLS